MKPTLDRSGAPLLVATFHPTITAAEVQAHFRELTDAVEELGRIGVVVDLTDPPGFTLPLGRVAGSEMRAAFPRIGDRVVGVAHVTPSAAARAMLAAVQWLAPPPFPTLVTSSEEEARSWVSERLGRTRGFGARADCARRDARSVAGLARALVAAGQARGVSIGEEELRAGGISRAELDDLDGYVPYGALIHLLTVLARRDGVVDVDIGLRAGAEFVDAAGFGIVGLAARSSANLGEAIARIARYVRLVDENAEMALHQDAAGIRVSLEPLPPLEWPAPYAELLLAAFVTLGRAWTGLHFAATAVGFRHDAPACLEQHARVFGCAPTFGGRENFIVFPPEALGRHLPYGHPLQGRYFDRRLDELARARAVAPGPLGDVRAEAQRLLPHGTPTIESISQRLGVSRRTLQRRLNERGVTFGDILDSVKREAALVSIMRPGASVQQLAESSGFTDVKAFRRAFLRWTGQSPSEYRRSRN